MRRCWYVINLKEEVDKYYDSLNATIREYFEPPRTLPAEPETGRCVALSRVSFAQTEANTPQTSSPRIPFFHVRRSRNSSFQRSEEVVEVLCLGGGVVVVSPPTGLVGWDLPMRSTG